MTSVRAPNSALGAVAGINYQLSGVRAMERAGALPACRPTGVAKLILWLTRFECLH
jgi:hypothetical protein